MPARKKYTVSVVNPSRRRRGKKTAKRRAKKTTKRRATKKRATTKRKPTRSKTMARRRRKTTTRRRSTTRRAPARRRRRTTAAAPRRRSRRRTRANPRARGKGKNLGGFYLDPMEPWNGLLPRIAGKLFSVWAVKRWGDVPGSPNSPTTGGAWTFKNYLFSMLAGYLGGELVARTMDASAGRNFYRGAADFTATKAMWSELVMRWGWSQQALGSAYPSFGGSAYPSFGNVEVRQLMAEGQPGDILDDGQGNRYLNKGGRWVAMMGCDGMGSDIVEAGPLGADIVEAGPLGSVMVEAGPLGHMMPAASTRADEARGAYTYRGSKDPYRAAYM